MDVFRVVHIGYQVQNADGDVLATRRLKGAAIKKAKEAAEIAAGTGVDAEVHVINDLGRVESKPFFPAVQFDSGQHEVAGLSPRERDVDADAEDGGQEVDAAEALA